MFFYATVPDTASDCVANVNLLDGIRYEKVGRFNFSS